MNSIFDGSVPRPLRRFLAGHTVKTAQAAGWGELRNGDLIHAAENSSTLW